jgi:nuclear transport factor 2 (NTF2) superfamily protein
MSKYYTPKIEEFVVGFEYELQDDSGVWLWSNIPQDKKLLEKLIKDDRCRSLKNKTKRR